MVGYIYKITNKVNGMVYIGATTNTIRNRFKQHMAIPKYHDEYGQKKFYDDILEFGEDNFEIEELLKITRGDLEEFKREIIHFENYYINLFDSIEKGYNTIKSTSFNVGFDKRNLGTHSEETRKKMSESMKGKKLSEDELIKASKVRKQAVICLNDGKVFEGVTECMEHYDVKLRLRAKVSRGLESYKGLSFRYVDKEGNVMPIQSLKEKMYIKCSNGKIYKSLREASLDIGTNEKCIHAVVSKITNSSMKHTFQWCSLEEVEELLSNGYKLFFKD